MNIYGFANHDIHYIHQRLKTLLPEIRCQLAEKNMKVKKSTNVILCVKAEKLFEARHSITKPCVVFVFDSPLYLAHIENIVMLDVKKTDGINYQFKSVEDAEILRAFTNVGVPIAKKKTVDVFAILETKLTHSCLSPILTFLYSVQNKEKREEFRNLIFKWLFSKEKQRSLQTKLRAMSGQKRNANLDTLIERLNDQQFMQLKEALATILPIIKAGNSVNYEQTGKKFGVAPFDLRYLIKYKTGATQSGEGQKTKKVRHKVIKLKTSK